MVDEASDDIANLLHYAHYTGGRGSRGGGKTPRKTPPKRRPYDPTKRKPRPLLPFMAWDGEGYTDKDGIHRYYLFGCDDGQGFSAHVVNPEGLTHRECFELLLTVGQRSSHINVIFAGSYDVTMMIHRFPTHVATRITKGLTTHWDGYRFEWFKGKFLKLSDGVRSIILYDVFTFFATSFVKACEEYLGKSDDIDRIAEVKQLRDSFTLDDLERLVMPYWRQELRYLIRLCDTLRQHFRDAHIPVRQWHGPGAVASAVLRQRGIRAHMATPPPDVLEASRHAYYGGRFEQFKIGEHTGDVYQYDIRSAYPYAITKLPSLAGVTWRRGQRRKDKINHYGLYQISWETRPSLALGAPNPLPWRAQDRSIFYPPIIRNSWYWGIELNDLLHTSDGTLTIHDAWEPQGTGDNYPFQFISEMYHERARMKQEGDPTQLALKLAMNSIYGKLAQSKGARKRQGEWQLPAYHQLEWAGWITAYTRTMIRRAISDIGWQNLIAIETDAIYSTTPIPPQGFTYIDIGPDLGQWDPDHSDAIMYIQSGVYFKRYGNDWKLKSRGFEPRNHTAQTWHMVLTQLPANPTLTIATQTRRFGGIPGTTNYAKWYSQTREGRIIGTTSKRIHIPSLCEACNTQATFADIMHTLVVPEMIEPCSLAETVPSTPHHLPWIEDNLGDWEDDWLITEDGYSYLEIIT